MKRALTGLLVSLTIMGAPLSAASAATPLSLSTSFSPSTVSIGETTELTFTLTGGEFTDVWLDALFPPGLTVAASSSSQCGGTLTTTPPDSRLPGDADEVTLDGASIAAGDSCTFSVPVTAESAGDLTVRADATALRGDAAFAQTQAVLTVPATASAARVTSAFTPDKVPDSGTTTWTVQIANPNTSTTLTDVRFFTVMPVTHIWLIPEAITGDDCGGHATVQPYVSVAPSGPSVGYRGGSLAPGAQCRITVGMSVQWTPFDHDQVYAIVASNEGGESPVSTATVSELAPPPPSNAFTHSKPKIARDGTVTETVKLPAKGTVRLRENWRGKLIAHVKRTATTSGKLTLKLAPSAPTRRALRSHRAARLKLSVAYTPDGGQTRTVKLTARTPG